MLHYTIADDPAMRAQHVFEHGAVSAFHSCETGVPFSTILARWQWYQPDHPESRTGRPPRPNQDQEICKLPQKTRGSVRLFFGEFVPAVLRQSCLRLGRQSCFVCVCCGHDFLECARVNGSMTPPIKSLFFLPDAAHFEHELSIKTQIFIKMPPPSIKP